MLPSFQEWLAAAEADAALHHTASPIAQATPPPPSASQAALAVLVIGAGPGGLCAMRALLARSVSCACLEQHSGVGGIWDVSSFHSSVYSGLLTNASRFSMTLDKPWDMPATDPLYPTEKHILTYLNAFADKHDIRRHCRFGCRVEQVTFDEAEQCWQVRWKVIASGEERTERYADVVAASGLNGRSSAHIPPELAAQCEAAQLPYEHSSAIKQPADYKHKRVLVVGLGTSGADMAAQLAQHAERVFVAVRTSQYFAPAVVYGQPFDKLVGGDMPNLSALPRWLAGALLWAGTGVLQRVERLMTESWAKAGLKRPDCSALEHRIPVPDTGAFFAAVKEGKAQLRNAVRAFSAGSVQYAGSGVVESSTRSDAIDCVVFCTGYRFLHPYLPSHLTPQPRRPVHIPTGRFPDLGQLTPHTLTSDLTFLLFSPHNEHLYSMTEVQAGYHWMVFQEQAATIAATIAARRQRTERIRRFNRVASFPNVAFSALMLRGSHEFRPNEEFVVERSLYTNFLRQYVAWVEGEGSW